MISGPTSSVADEGTISINSIVAVGRSRDVHMLSIGSFAEVPGLSVELISINDTDDEDDHNARNKGERNTEAQEEEEPPPKDAANITPEKGSSPSCVLTGEVEKQTDDKFNSKVHCAGSGRQTDGIYYCALCDFQHRNYVSIRDHFYKNHQTESLLKCSFCARKFLRGARLKDHVRSKHSNEKPFRCEKCTKCFASTSARIMHFKSAHMLRKSRER